MAEYTEKRQAGKQELEITVRRLPISFQQTLKTIFGNVAITERERQATDFNLGQAENIVMRDSITMLKVNGHRVALATGDPLEHLPQHGEDQDYQDEVIEKILQVCVKYNKVLHNERKPWGAYFQQYAEDPEAIPEDEREGFSEHPAVSGSPSENRMNENGNGQNSPAEPDTPAEGNAEAEPANERQNTEKSPEGMSTSGYTPISAGPENPGTT